MSTTQAKRGGSAASTIAAEAASAVAAARPKKAIAAVKEQGDGPRTALIKQAVLDTAAKIFAEKGYGGTSLKDVASNMGISRAGLYYHFPTKEALLEALIEEVTVSSQRQSSAIAERAELEPEEALRIVTQTHARWILEHGTLFKVVDRSEAELPPRLLDLHSTAKRAVLDNFTRIIDRGVDRGLFKPIDARVAAFTIIGMCSWTAWWFKTGGKQSVDEVVETISAMAVSSLARSDPGGSGTDDPIAAMDHLRQGFDHLERLVRKGR